MSAQVPEEAAPAPAQVSSILGKRRSRSPEKPKESLHDVIEREYKAPRTNKNPRRIPQPKEDRGKGGVILDEASLIDLGLNEQDCKGEIVLFDSVTREWTTTYLSTLQQVVWDIKSENLEGNFSVNDIGTIHEFLQSLREDDQVFLKFCKEIDGWRDVDSYVPTNAKYVLFF